MVWTKRSNPRVGLRHIGEEEYSPQMDGTQTRVDEQSPRVKPDKAGKMRPRSEEQAGAETAVKPENHTPTQSEDPDRLPDAGPHHHHPRGEVAAALRPRRHGKRYSPEEAETSARTWKRWRF